MSFFLLILMLAVLLILELVKSSKRKTAGIVAPAKMPAEPSVIGQRFFHRGHVWATIDSKEQVTVGPDDFAQTLIGDVSEVRLPDLGTVVKQGEVIGSLRRNRKVLPQVAPLSGTIVAVNPKLARNPGLINTSPLEKGWTVRIAPWNLQREIRNLLNEGATERWQRAVRDGFIAWISQSHLPALQDGGTLISNISDTLDDDQWQKVVQEFFQVSDRTNSIKNIKDQ